MIIDLIVVLKKKEGSPDPKAIILVPDSTGPKCYGILRIKIRNTGPKWPHRKLCQRHTTSHILHVNMISKHICWAEGVFFSCRIKYDILIWDWPDIRADGYQQIFRSNISISISMSTSLSMLDMGKDMDTAADTDVDLDILRFRFWVLDIKKSLIQCPT
jgi:hypothetical protein